MEQTKKLESRRALDWTDLTDPANVRKVFDHLFDLVEDLQGALKKAKAEKAEKPKAAPATPPAGAAPPVVKTPRKRPSRAKK